MDYGFNKRLIVAIAVAALPAMAPVSSAFADNFTYTTLNVPDVDMQHFGSIAYSINNSGVVAGTYSRSVDAENRGFLFDSGYYSSFLHPGGTIATELRSISDNGNLAGNYYNPSVGSIGFANINGVYTDIDDPNNFSGTYVYSVNNSGVVAGYYFGLYNGVGGTYGFTYDNGAYTNIIVPNSSSTWVLGINNNGDLAGYYQVNSGVNGSNYGFVERNGVFTTISHPNAPTSTYVTGLNNRGEVVGYYITGDANQSAAHGFLFDGSNYITIDNPDAVFIENGSYVPGDTWLTGINDLGQVTGYYGAVSSQGNLQFYTNKAFYVNTAPVPLPAAVWLFGSALVGLLRFSRRIELRGQ